MEPPDETPSKPTRQRMGSSMITAIAAGIVSLSALGVSIYEAYLMREQQAASVLPIVDFWAGYELGGAYALNLANKGLGPGFIKDIEVSVDQGSHDNWGQVMAAVNGKRVPRTESALIGSVLAPGDIATLVSIQDPTLAGEVWGEASRISLSVCFCSVFKNCWTMKVANLNTGTPKTQESKGCLEDSPRLF